MPPKNNAQCVSPMEESLEVSQRPYDARSPHICMDAGSKQWLADTRTGAPMEAGKPARSAKEYKRHGTVKVLVACQPLAAYWPASAWQHQRDQAHATSDWRFTSAAARIKLKHLSPPLK